MTAAVRERATVGADYMTFLLILDTIRAGAYFTVEDIRTEIDALQLSPNTVGCFFRAAYEAGVAQGWPRALHRKLAHPRRLQEVRGVPMTAPASDALADARVLARECQGLVSKYTRAPGEKNGDRVADLLSEDTYRIGTAMLATLDRAVLADPETVEAVADATARSRRGVTARVNDTDRYGARQMLAVVAERLGVTL